ncbi:putative transcription factor B3-Domain family [Helianthus debilis subsp. tardiflorus]
MLPSHVTGGFWLGFPKKFCDAHMPKQDETVVLLDENDQEFNTKFLVDKTGLSGGWRGFSIAHNLLEGDALVFQLVDRWKFKVYVVRVNDVNEVDGALALLSLVPCGIKNDSKKIQNAEEMDIDLPKQHIQENSLVVSDQSSDDSYYSDSPVSEGLRFSQSVLQFKEIKSIDDFSLNVKLAAGVILETVTIADAIRACKVGVTRDDFDIWDKTLKAFEEMGMKVGFLRGRISKLVGLLFDSNKHLEAKKIEQEKAEDEMRIMSKKLCGIKDVIKNLDAEIETLKLTGKNLEIVFCREANAPW